MKKRNNGIFGDFSIVWEFFYNLTYVSSIPTFLFIAFWLIQYAMLMTPSILLIFYNTQWSTATNFIQYFSILSYIQYKSGIEFATYFIFAIIQIFYILCAIQLIRCKFNISCIDKNDKYSLIYQAIHLIFILCSTSLLQASLDLLIFLANYINTENSSHYAPYKNISQNINLSNSEVYILLILASFSTVQILFAAIINSLFCQDRSLKQQLIWSPNAFYNDLLMLLCQIFTRIYFVLFDDVFFL